MHTSSHDWQSKLHDDTILYIDSDGSYDFKGFHHLCVIITVWRVTLHHLYKDCFLDFLFPKGWLCFPFPSLGSCGWVGDEYDHKSGHGDDKDWSSDKGSGGGLHAFALNAQAVGDGAQSDSGDDSFADQVQAQLAAGELDSLSIVTNPSDEPSPDPSDTTSGAESAGSSSSHDPTDPTQSSSSATASEKPSPTGTKTATASSSPPPGPTTSAGTHTSTASDTPSSKASSSDSTEAAKASTSSGAGT